MTKIQNIIQKFLWPNGLSEIKKKVIQQSINDGGLKGPNFENQMIALRIIWVKRVMSGSKAILKQFFYAFFSVYFNLKDVFYCRFWRHCPKCSPLLFRYANGME